MDEDDQPYRRPPPTSSSTIGGSTSLRPENCSLEYAMERAKLMFGCYRRGDANDPETYVAACTSVLSRYPAEIVKAVTDPYSGLPSRKSESGWSGLPDVADVKEACEAEAVRRARLAELAALPRPNFNRPRLRPPPAGQGAWATISVGPDAPQYEKFKARTAKADPREWRWEGSTLYVPMTWFDGPTAFNDPLFKPFTDDELRELYSGAPK